MLPLWILIGLAILLGLLSLRSDFQRKRYVAERLAVPPGSRTPPATVIVPVKGPDEGLRENLAALAGLDYADYEIIVAARAATDIPDGVLPPTARTVIAGEGDPANGEKINNLLAAVRAARPESEIFAFADSDGRVSPQWLRALAAGLEKPGAGAATGYRWHTPDPPDLWSILRSAWNAVIAGGFGAGYPKFAWGGAMAIRRDTFHRTRVSEFWHGSISDDFALTRAVQSAGLRVIFAPAAFVADTSHTGAREFLAWIRRQLIITCVYRPRLWAAGFVAHVLYCSAYLATVAITLSGNWFGLAALAAIWSIGAWKGASRAATARASLPQYKPWFRRHAWLYPLLDPAATWLWMYALVASAFSRTIEWRGNRYRLSAKEVRKLG